MRLDAYIKDSGATEQEIAEATGYSQGTINKLRNGKINPTMQLLTAIAKATNGAVTPNDFLPPFRGDKSATGAARAQAAQETSEKVKGAAA
jgi:transcriptional regulator with XRE-family HTH domain